MNLIKVTSLVKKRTKDILTDLMPEYKYHRVTNSGLVVLKKRWWHLKRTIINITDLYIDIIPKRLAENCRQKGYGDTYDKLFSNDIYVMLQIRAYKKEFNLVDYVWDKYNVLYREVPIIKVTTNVAMMVDPSSIYLPVLSPVSSKYIPGVERLIRNMKKNSVEGLIEKISKIKAKNPLVLVRHQVLCAA
jgi:hypothetical protein